MSLNDVPRKRNSDVVLIDGESEVKELQLAVVSIQQVATGSTVLPCTSHVLAQPVESDAFLVVSFGIFTIGLPDVILKGLDPVDLVGLL